MELNYKYRHLYNSYNQTSYNKETDLFEYFSYNDFALKVDLSDYFPDPDPHNVYSHYDCGITSSCAIVSVMSYYLKKYYNIDKILSPSFLAYHQHQSTQNWNTIDLLTGINVASNIGICSSSIFDNDVSPKIIENIQLNKFIELDASQHTFGFFNKIDPDVDTIENIINDTIPVLCSFKIIPYYKEKIFYNSLNDFEYWSEVEKYYSESVSVSDSDSDSESEFESESVNNHIYSVSVVIVGYDHFKKQFKIRGWWDDVSNNGYFYIDYNIFESFYDLFFDAYIVDIKSSLSNCNIIELNNNFQINIVNDDNYQIIKFPSSGQKSPRRRSEMEEEEENENKNENEGKEKRVIKSSKKESFKKISSMTNICESFINIESLSDLNCLTNSIFENNI